MKDRPEQSKSQQIPGIKKSGYVTFWRNFKGDPLWKEERKFSQFEAFLDLYVKAQGVDTDNFLFRKRLVELKRGQLVTSTRLLAADWNWSRGGVRNFLRKLERRQTIKVESFRSKPPRTVITFLKYNELNPIGEKK